jgi:hypothetical protein
MLVPLAHSFMGPVHFTNTETRTSITTRIDTHARYALRAIPAPTFRAKSRYPVLKVGDSGTEGSESSLERGDQQDTISVISDADRLKKWNKDFEYLPDVQTWNRACVALQVITLTNSTDCK